MNQIQTGFLRELEKLILKFLWKSKKPEVTKKYLKEGTIALWDVKNCKALIIISTSIKKGKKLEQ